MSEVPQRPVRETSARGRILVVDDEANARAALSEILRDEGYATETAADGFKALGKLEEFAPDVVLTDLKMPGLDGIAFMEKAKSASPQTVFVVMTAFGTISSAVAAIKKGAENYLTKPLDYEALSAVVDRAMEKAKLLQETHALRDRLRERNAFGHIVTEDPKMRALLDLVAQVGPSKATVLITGESGTGKELIAEALCGASTRASAPFIRLHCAALAESLLESELFGHERGAFTGAVARREGRFKQADGGTLFLDEIGEIPLGTQVKLLRFLQDKSFERVGGNETLKVDVRLVAATNRDLKAAIKSGAFREDLFYRLNVIAVELPPLRERRSDIGPLASFFLGRYAKENGRNIEGITEPAVKLLTAYDWPGNVREQRTAIEHGVVMTKSGKIALRDLPAFVREGASVGGGGSEKYIPVRGSRFNLHDTEHRLILQALDDTGGNITQAAKKLGISRRTLHRKINELKAAEDVGQP